MFYKVTLDMIRVEKVRLSNGGRGKELEETKQHVVRAFSKPRKAAALLHAFSRGAIPAPGGECFKNLTVKVEEVESVEDLHGMWVVELEWDDGVFTFLTADEDPDAVLTKNWIRSPVYLERNRQVVATHARFIP